MKTIILGAGITGLSLAYFLEKQGNSDYLLFESYSEIGGWCRSIRKKGFIFDLASHLLHIKNPEIAKLIKELIGNELILKKRHGGIFFNGKIIPYPFQFNLYHLDEKIKKECLDNALEAKEKFKHKIPANFKEWAIMTMGEGIARHFMIPYNKKCYCIDPSELTFDFFEKYMQAPSLDQIREGAERDMSNSKFGYYHEFEYPKSGGIDCLPKALASRINNIHLNEKAIKINLSKRIIFTNKSSYCFDTLISTMPMPELINSIEDAPNEIKKAAEKLRCSSLSFVLLGINRKKITDYQWLYLPEDDLFPFRLSFPMNFCESMAPENMSSICAEYSYLGDKKFSDNEIIKKTIDDLIKIGILKNREEIIFKDIANLKYGYAVFDFNRKENLELIQNYLKKYGIYSIGRFGTWQHSSMEDAIDDAKEAVAEINGKI